jgi:hypothetical protein
MAATKSKRTTSVPRRPEIKYGPFHAGVGIAIWINEVKTENGTRFFRTLTIQGRRYLDKRTGLWLDAESFRSTDIPALILALEAAHRHMLETPLPGQPVEEEAQMEEPTAPTNGDGTVAF